jgi:lipoyl(octanoyl) transferase
VECTGASLKNRDRAAPSNERFFPECKEEMTYPQATCWVVDLGAVRYAWALEFQRRAVAARKNGNVPDLLLFCEHFPVITLGRNGKREHLRGSESVLRQMNVEFHDTERGGDITFHGPGQIVGYPILDLTQLKRDVRWYVEQLEDVMIAVAAECGIGARRAEGMHGVWVPAAGGGESEKLGALGVHISRWVTSHGFAYNVSTDLRNFDLIVPCGLQRKATSLEKILGRAVAVEDVKPRLAANFAKIFGREMRSVALQDLEAAMHESAASGADAHQPPYGNEVTVDSARSDRT